VGILEESIQQRQSRGILPGGHPASWIILGSDQCPPLAFSRMLQSFWYLGQASSGIAAQSQTLAVGEAEKVCRCLSPGHLIHHQVRGTNTQSWPYYRSEKCSGMRKAAQYHTISTLAPLRMTVSTKQWGRGWTGKRQMDFTLEGLHHGPK
jgi:hypothetical protein